ncbi:hypothetical protein L208DRAFT_1380334 [Tricholoma matsutake]|nr:hypothetical protein L208DRAFT_1380334 [Tricholoma matsutake 945]
MEEVEAWEKDPSQPNPFEVKVITPTQAAVHHQLSEAEAWDLAARQDFSLDKNMSPSGLISSGIDLKAVECISHPHILHALGVEAGKVWAHAQDRQHMKLQLQSNARHCKINLRIGQAYELLELLRGTLQTHSYLFWFTDCFIQGQTANTRAQGAISMVQAWQLLAKIGWQDGLLPLTDMNVWEIMEGEEVAGLEENEGLQDGLCIEWCKSWAWAMHFMEEVELLQEEMEHVLCFLQWQENWWRMKGQCEGWRSLSKIWIEALQDFAEHQATLHQALHTKFSDMGRNVPEFVKLNQETSLLRHHAPLVLVIVTLNFLACQMPDRIWQMQSIMADIQHVMLHRSEMGKRLRGRLLMRYCITSICITPEVEKVRKRVALNMMHYRRLRHMYYTRGQESKKASCIEHDALQKTRSK